MGKRKNCDRPPARAATFREDPTHPGAYIAVDPGDGILRAGYRYSWKQLQLGGDALDIAYPKARLAGKWLRQVTE